jgi:hypothetical protein
MTYTRSQCLGRTELREDQQQRQNVVHRELTRQSAVVNSHTNDGHANGTVKGVSLGISFPSDVEGLHSAKPKHTYNGKLAASWQLELPDLYSSQQSAQVLVAVLHTSGIGRRIVKMSVTTSEMAYPR